MFLIFKKYCSLFCGFASQLIMISIKGFLLCHFPSFGIIFFSGYICTKSKLYNTSCAVVDVFFRKGAILNRSYTVFPHVIASSGHIQIASGLEAFDPVIHRSPVCHNHTFKAPLIAENFRKQLLIITAMNTIQFWICTHDSRRMTLFHCRLKGRQIEFSQGTLIHDAVGIKTAFFLRISREMFET